MGVRGISEDERSVDPSGAVPLTWGGGPGSPAHETLDLIPQN